MGALVRRRRAVSLEEGDGAQQAHEDWELLFVGDELCSRRR